MAEAQQPPPVTAPTALPTARLEDEHLPAVSSPLNPDAAASRTRREKKATFKARGDDADSKGTTKKRKRSTEPTHISPMRYKLPLPKAADYEPPKAPTFSPIPGREEWMESSEHVYNRKSFRYTKAISDPSFPALQYHRQTETASGSSFEPEDTSPHVFFSSPNCTAVTTQKGFRMARATTGAREGRYYWEAKILSGIRADPMDGEPRGHVRIGFARREAQLDGPVGFDAYSYGIRDVSGQKVHMSRPKDFANADFVEGDVIGLEICLPSLSLHRKVAEGTYNKAVDVSDDLDPIAAHEYLDIIRDRVPIRFKNTLYFEQYEYSYQKPLEDLMNPAPTASVGAGTAATDPPNPNHPEPSLRTLPFSSMKVYKNGELLGTPYTDLLAFLPPSSKPPNQAGAREGFDDGSLGYYPAISVFRGGAAEANFGPRFWFPPPDLAVDEDTEMADSSDIKLNPVTKKQIAGQHSNLRPMSERFNEQIAEDIVYDLVDEVDFWSQCIGDTEADMNGFSEQGTTALLDPEASDVLGSGREIKQLVQDEV
ncbi:hypothetical protein HO133_001671 [Letharia lupina]|uniref:B30.2/SPRY domain-containing protein n=2 Tax=Letharia TaxID=112415 RepID=A0A8H6FBE8_9LECA|nr:uncharacterized protein HO133_001671 [Letharia lupina]XP_037164436.1 uncharacterized protein HO173_006685 [Letharia columbiana]KAF6221703.1 hypothetical protein HO133_001671 [Letharia lupina]KAF6235058.1 hypothetical protein HO173_006685 [Letharia columbiana]